MKTSTKVILIGIVLLLIIAPLTLLKDAKFGGSDSKAENLITATNPEYKPWFESLFKPASSEVESLLFAVQASLGASIVSYYLGYKKGKKANAASR